MRRAPGSEAVRARPKVLLVNRLQHHGDRPLRHLVLEGRDAERPLRAVRLEDVCPAHRRCLVAAGLDAIEEVREIGRQVRLVLRRRHTVDAGCTILAGELVGPLHPFQVDDVVQQEQRCSRLLPRQFGYPLSFRGQVRGVHAPSRVSHQRFSPHDASLPSLGSRRARFPALSGTMKALRLPTRASTVAHWFAPAAHAIPPHSCSPWRSRKVGGPFQAGGFDCTGCPKLRFSHVDANGISQVFRRSFLCLCSAPGPRSSQRALAIPVTSMLPPLDGRRRLRQCLISGLTRSFGTCCHTLHADVAAHVQGLLPAGWLAFAGWASNPLDRDERFQLVLTIIPLSCSPDATTLRDGVAAHSPNTYSKVAWRWYLSSGVLMSL